MLAAVTEMGLWQDLYKGWVDQPAKHSKLALDAGVQERQVRLAEQIGAQFAMALREIYVGLKLTRAQAAKWESVVRTHMLAIDTQLAS